MINDQVEKHHLIFYTVTILVIFLVEYFIKWLSNLKSDPIGLIFYILLLILFTNLLLFVIYGHAVMNFLGFDYKTENPISDRDILLTSPAIITTFLIDDLFNSVKSLIPEYSLLLTIILLPFLYLGIYKINKGILPYIFP
ncbi:MAG: hypothetical protein KKG94_00015 [Nanoarchaeota archaeon]|nr:hypothetical protein [Nanoarchaeota archaeon]